MTYKSVARLITDMREATNLTQSEFGELFGTTGNTVSRWEKGVCSPRCEVFLEIIVACGLNQRQLAGTEMIGRLDKVLDEIRRRAKRK